MCGIVGAASNRPIVNILIDGLKRLEYRGYDSAGIAVIDHNHELKRLRVKGKVKELENALKSTNLEAHIGIAHTRWATHGVPSEENAHPLLSHGRLALVHNGIIENHTPLRQKLLDEGYQFNSETDTETAVHLIHYYFEKHKDLVKAVRSAANELEGAYALVIVSLDAPDRIIGVRQGAPLVVGRGKGENFIVSDSLALLSITQDFIYLEDNDIAEVSANSIRIFDEKGEVERKTHKITFSHDAVERGDYSHYMQKEIKEEPKVIANCLEGRITKHSIIPGMFGTQLDTIFPDVQHIHLVACGTSFHAAMVGKYWLEQIANIPCSVEIASEFRYRYIAVSEKSLFVTLSQSGETADTLAALRLAKTLPYLKTLAICNVQGSTMTREADAYFLTRAGTEIGVASTKAFVTQLVALFLLALTLKHAKHNQEKMEETLVKELETLPETLKKTLTLDHEIIVWAHTFAHKNHALFLGRGALFPIALEGALKLKEISYIHAEGYPGGELKHGPLALVDENMPVIAILSNDRMFDKMLSNLQEVHARGGKLFILVDEKQKHAIPKNTFSEARILGIPSTHPLLFPITSTIPLQLLAYHVAVLKGTDVDQPRNLAKSVTVE